MVLPLGDLQRTQIFPVVNYTLIALNVILFLVQQEKGEPFTLAFAATPWEITHNKDIDEPVPHVVQVLVRDRFGGAHVEERERAIEHFPCPIPVRWTLLTSMFLHGSWMHLIGNMLYLWIVGDNVEEVLGSFRYLIVYLACGLVRGAGADRREPQFGDADPGGLGRDRGDDGGLCHLVPASPDSGASLPVHHRAAGGHRHRRLDRASDLAGSQLARPDRRVGWCRLPRPRRRRCDRNLRGLPFQVRRGLYQGAERRRGGLDCLRGT